VTEVLLWAVFIFFVIATASLAVYGLHLYVLLILFRRRVDPIRKRQAEIIEKFVSGRSADAWPGVTTQIPIYNEADVVERIILAIADMDYPKGFHEIQVLDDSTDETRYTVDRIVKRLCGRGVNIHVIRRTDRSGYKAGALANGLALARGKYVAVFDSDFVPPSDFLHRAVPLLEADDTLACLQGRWSHLNQDESWLTRSQALGIDGHFAVEQGARAWNGLMMNFNGTAGVWRKSAIEDPKVGGWSGDTLTEDLDLSYRVQLAGWRLDYCLDLPCPAELPGTVSALKSQQKRWATGSIQVARKLLPAIWRSPCSLGVKLEATLHLTHYSVAVWMLMLALAARPMLIVFYDGVLSHEWFVIFWSVVLISAVAPSLVYAYARYQLGGRWSGLRTIPGMMLLGCGLCLSNSIAVLRGLVLRGGEFVRTPKSGSVGDQARVSTYRVVRSSGLWIAEIILGVYSFASFIMYLQMYRSPYSVFLLIYAVGFCVIGWLSRPERPGSTSPHARETTQDVLTMVASPPPSSTHPSAASAASVV